MKAKVSITRMGTTKGKANIAIAISDTESRLPIIELEMHPVEFVECLTGLNDCYADIVSLIGVEEISWVGKKRETKEVYVDWDKITDSIQELYDMIEDNDSYLEEGWMIWDDGTKSQQNRLHDKGHRVSLYRFVNSEGKPVS